MTERPTLAQQADAVLLVVQSQAASIRQRELNGGKDKHPTLGVDKAWLPILESALETLRWLQANEADVREFVEARRAKQGRVA